MSEVNELLDNLTDQEMLAYSVDSSEEPHIVIDRDRFITVPDELKRIAVQYDHNIETVTFDCPRFWDDHDLSEMQIFINYTNGSIMGSYLADNLVIEDDIIHFSWTISQNVTRNKGTVVFLVCAKTSNENEELVTHWNSELCRDLYISEGLETSGSITTAHADIITQLLTRMDNVLEVAVTDENVAEIFTNYISKYPDIFKGAAGKSAYDYAKDGGYTGTEEEFAKKMAEEIPALKVPVDLKVANDRVEMNISDFDYFVLENDYGSGVIKVELNNIERVSSGGGAIIYAEAYYMHRVTSGGGGYTNYAYSVCFTPVAENIYTVDAKYKQGDASWSNVAYTRLYGCFR